MKKHFVKLYKNQGNPWYYINKILINGSVDDYERLSNFVTKKSSIKSQLDDFLFPNSFNISRTPYFYGIKTLNIVIWDCLLINKNSSKINEFNCLKSSYESEYLMGNYEEAKVIIEKIEKSYGISLWLLENKLLLNKTGFSNYNLNFESGIEQAFISYLSIKTEINEKNIYYPEKMGKLIESNVKDSIIANFLKYYLLVKRPNSSEWNSVLFLVNQLSLIDTYFVIRDVILDINNFSISNEKLNKILLLLENIEDKVIIYNIDKNFKRINDVNFNTDLFYAIKNFDTCTLFFDEFSKNPKKFVNSVYSYKLMSIYSIIDNTYKYVDNSISKLIFDLIYNILSMKDIYSFVKAIDELGTLSRVYSSFCIGKGLLLFINEILETNMLFSNEISFSTYEDYLFANYINNSNSLLLSPEKNIDRIDIDKYTSWIVENIDSECDLYNYYRILQLKLEMIKANESNDNNHALNIALNAYIENKLFIFSLDIDNISRSIQNKIKTNDCLSIEEICYLYIDGNLKENIKSSSMNYLDNDKNPFSDPIELLSKNEDKRISEFFLYFLCDLDFLKGLYWLIRTDDAAINYRIRILKELLNNNSIIDKKSLNSEINDLTKRLILKNRVQKINSSRIMIESSKIWKEVEDRLLVLIKQYNNANENERFYFEFDMKNPSYVVCISAKEYILQQIYYEYSNAFCFGKYGIDDSLSTRVRHGAFTNHIINVFSEGGIIPKNDQKSLLEELISNNTLTDEALLIIDDFIKKTSELLEFTKKHSLKVKINENINGAIFDYNLQTEDEIHLGKALNNNYLTTETVSLLLNEIIINKTNNLLSKVRNELLPDILKQLHSYLDELNEKIHNCKTKNDNNIDMEISKLIIDCKSSLDRAFAEISNWFYLSEIDTWEDYKFNDLLETTNEVNKKLFFNYSSINISINDTEYLLDGKTFRNFTDIFLILFNNSIVHSGLSTELNKLFIDINIFENDNEIGFTFSNNVSNNLDIDQLDKKINLLNDIVMNKKYLDVDINNEGGMGLYKIMNLIFVINQYGKNIYFFRKENTFNVCITFRKDYILNEKNIDC